MKPSLGDILAGLLWFLAMVGAFWFIGYVFGWWDWWGAVL